MLTDVFLYIGKRVESSLKRIHGLQSPIYSDVRHRSETVTGEGKDDVVPVRHSFVRWTLRRLVLLLFKTL